MEEVLHEHRHFVSQHGLAGCSGEACAAALIFPKRFVLGECFFTTCSLVPKRGIFFTLWMHDLRSTLMLFMA